MKAESAIIITIAVCVFLSFYFSLLSFMTTEDLMKQQFVLLAVYSLLSGVIVFGCLLIYLIIMEIFEKTTLTRLQISTPLDEQQQNA
ncbi:MAG: hypothetical protein NZ932_05215 [Candidatus Bathyarchaeota archaeon]|nr:hypothetical protein [Candidatus Bathyarchaeota archaeon]MDW8040731.1 hypothetical protein [Nitrososphaerota archaeon]